MTTTLMQANREWSMRPADERFSSIQELHDAALGLQNASYTKGDVITKDLRVAADENSDDMLIYDGDEPYKLTNYSFAQLSRIASAPANYLAELPTELAASCINVGLQEKKGQTNIFAKRDRTGMDVLRSLTSDRYDRIWNSEITRRLLEIEAEGTWKPAPAAFDGSRGLYHGDRSMFAFLVDNERRIFETGPEGGLSRGFFVSNSEVAAAAFKIITFHYEYVCGNHRVWGAQQIDEISIRHVGEANQKAFAGLEAELKRYADSSAHEDELRVEAMRTMKLGNDFNEVLDRVLNLRIPGIGSRMVAEAYKTAVEKTDWYGDPNTVWGFTGGLTQVARDLTHADERVKLERAASQVMDLVTV